MMVLYGQSSGPVGSFSPALLAQKGSLFLTRPTLFHYIADRAHLEWRAGEVLQAIAAGRLAVRIGATFPLVEAADAHRALEGRKTTGKVLLIPWPSVRRARGGCGAQRRSASTSSSVL